MASEFNYREVSCNKSVRGIEFERGTQDYSFSIGAPSVWIPRKSYFKVSLKITGKNGQPLKTSDCVAFADDVCGSLYNNAYFRVGGQDVSVLSNYLPQCSILKNRMNRSNAWLKTIGRSASFVEADFSQRLGRLANDTPDDVTSRPVVLPIKLFDDGKDDATVSLANDGVVTGNVYTDFDDVLNPYITGAAVRNTYIHINGFKFLVRSIPSVTTLLVDNPAGIVIAPTTDAYFVCQTPYKADGKDTLDVLWQPPLGIFDMASENTVDEVMGAGDYRFSLNPNSNYKLAALESTRRGAPASLDVLKPDPSIRPGYDNGGLGLCDIEVLDVKFYMAYAKMALEEKENQLQLFEMSILSKPISGLSNTYEFTLPSSTQSIAVFVQSAAVGASCNYPPSKFKLLNDGQNLLTGFQIVYGNTVKPSTKWVSRLDDNTNQLIQRYRDNLAETNQLYNYEGGGAESVEDYLERGLYITYNFQRDRDDRSTQCQVSLDFRDAIETNASVYVCAIYARQTLITTKNGAVVEVRSLN